MLGAMDTLYCDSGRPFSRWAYWHCNSIIIHHTRSRFVNRCTYLNSFSNVSHFIPNQTTEPNPVANLTAQQTSYEISVEFSPPIVIVGQIKYYVIECWSGNLLVYSSTVNEPPYDPHRLFQHQVNGTSLRLSHIVDIPAEILNQTT